MLRGVLLFVQEEAAVSTEQCTYCKSSASLAHCKAGVFLLYEGALFILDAPCKPEWKTKDFPALRIREEWHFFTRNMFFTAVLRPDSSYGRFGRTFCDGKSCFCSRWIRFAMSEVPFNNSIVTLFRYNDNIPTVTITEGLVNQHGEENSDQRFR